MKHDLTTGTWQDDTGCPISIVLAATSDVPGRNKRPSLLLPRTPREARIESFDGDGIERAKAKVYYRSMRLDEYPSPTNTPRKESCRRRRAERSLSRSFDVTR